MELEDRIYQENIVLNLEASSKKEVIQKLSDVLQKNGFIRDVNEFINDVTDRESQMTTGIGNGLAIPHGKSNAVIESTVVFAKTKKALDWNSLDNQPVTMIFLLAIANQDENNEHLRLLADISGKLMDDTFVDAIRHAESAERIKEILTLQD